MEMIELKDRLDNIPTAKELWFVLHPNKEDRELYLQEEQRAKEEEESRHIEFKLFQIAQEEYSKIEFKNQDVIDALNCSLLSYTVSGGDWNTI